jgi:beta-xylosidase
MKHKYIFFLILSIIFQKSFLKITKYTNPVLEKDAPDPSIIRGDN